MEEVFDDDKEVWVVVDAVRDGVLLRLETDMLLWLVTEELDETCGWALVVCVSFLLVSFFFLLQRKPKSKNLRFPICCS